MLPSPTKTALMFRFSWVTVMALHNSADMIGSWNLKPGSILSRQHFVGLVVVAELFCFGVKLQVWAQRDRILAQIDTITFEMFNGSVHRCRVVIKALDTANRVLQLRCRDSVSLANVVRNVAQVAHACRQMTGQRVSVQHAIVARLTGVDKVGKMSIA